LRSDSWQAAELLSNFLAGRGYGVNVKVMRKAAPELAMHYLSHERMQRLLENVAYVM
jgi:hypothetical protein